MKSIFNFPILSLFCSTALSFAAGFSILEQSPSGMGRSLAGMTAETTDPSALYFNPSSVGWFTSPSMTLGSHFLTGNVRFHNNQSTLEGKDSDNILGLSVIPNFAMVYPLPKDFTLNLTMSATSGTATYYPWKWIGRYFAVDTSIAVIEFQPSVSYRVTDTFSVAVGLMTQYADVVMRQALDRPSSLLPANDTRLRMTGDTWTLGFTAGMTWKPLENTTIGLGYRSKMRHDVTLKTRLTRGYADIYRSVMGDEASLCMDMPQNVNFGIIQKLNDSWRIMADLSWTDWSVMKEMTVKFKKGVSKTEEMNWHDNWRIALGTEYQLTEKWTLRAGTAFDERTVTYKYDKICKLPDSNRYWISGGASYQFNEKLRLDASFTHIFFQPTSIHQTHSDGRYVDGKFCGYTNLLSVGMKYDF